MLLCLLSAIGTACQDWKLSRAEANAPRLLCWRLQEFKGQQLKQLVHALCPAIYGHELVKAGVLLCLFGGVRKGSEDQASAPVRGDIHCLLVGDPGIGKSQLLKVQW